VNRLRVATKVLLFASLLSLAACGDDDAETTAASNPPASAASTSVPTSAETSSPAAAGSADDKKLCESARSAGEAMKKELIAAVQAADTPSPAVYTKILGGLDRKMTALASSGGDGKVATALRQMGTEAAKAAAAADPVTAAANPTFEKAGADLTAACKAAGVAVNF
jgi:hypothetical protein